MILVLNCGSQSIKWKLFNRDLKVKKEGVFHIFENRNYEKILISELGKIKQYQKDIKAIGHRFVHGGNIFKTPIIVKKENLKKLESLNDLAPLHNQFNISGIKFAQSIFPKAKHVVFFDTEFFSNLSEKVITYPLPEKIRNKYGIRKFGFHGISHEYAAREAARIMQKPVKNLKIITCHFGGGSSIAAIDKGKAVDTSMGFSPLDGVVMMTRPGSLDPGIILYLKDKVKNLEYVLNYESGLKGICGMTDMRDILKAVKRKNRKAKLALDIFIYSVQKYIGSYFAILGGCDSLVFTGAIGSGSAMIVNMICKNLSILKNTMVLSIKPDEELAIAQRTRALIFKK